MKNPISPSIVKYDHAINQHSLLGPQIALPFIIEQTSPQSILDVGCGRGTWLKAALDLGISDVNGVDGVEINASDLLFPAPRFKVQDLRREWSLGRKFDLALCLEVGEHLDEKYSAQLVKTLTSHADTVVFSAACPDQDGQNHINMQWPAYWQRLFNENGFSCSDEFRWHFWEDARIEPWYRQNAFFARRANGKDTAGNEPRLPAVIHPELLDGIFSVRFSREISGIVTGKMPVVWYLKVLVKAVVKKIQRAFGAAE